MMDKIVLGTVTHNIIVRHGTQVRIQNLCTDGALKY